MNEEKKKLSPVIIAGIVIGVLGGGVLLYILFFTGPSVDLASTTLNTTQAQLNTSFKTDLFNDPRVKQLRQYGPDEVQATQRGTKADPFQAF